jgi:hypothetical protein
MARRIRLVSLVALSAVFLAIALPAAAVETTETDEASPGCGGTIIAGLLEAEFGITTEEAIEWHEAGIGWGALFKVGVMASVTGAAFADLIAAAVVDADGEYEFSWGEWFHNLDEEQIAALGETYRNLGQMVSSMRRGHGRPDHAGGPTDKPARPDKPGRNRDTD